MQVATLRLLITLVLTLGLVNAASAADCSSGKRGLLVNTAVEQAVIDNFGPFSYYYDYGQTSPNTDGSGRTIYGRPFAPMFSAPSDVTAPNLAAAQANGNTLLTFNEPDGGTFTATPASLLTYWPQFEATGMRLGSPAVSTYTGASKTWLDTFMTLAQQQNRRVDFIAVHSYGFITGLAFQPQAAATETIRQLTEIHNLWNKPIWVTEFGLDLGTTNTYSNELAYMQAVMPQMDALPWVEKYFWWTPNSYHDVQVAGSTNSLADASFQPNILGNVYKDCTGDSTPPASPTDLRVQ